MAEESSEPTEIVPASGAPTGGVSPQYEFFPLQTLIDLEHQRIASIDKRTDVGLNAIKAQDAADQRQFEYHMERLRTDGERSQGRHSLAKTIFYWGGTTVIASIVLLLGMLFFGATAQSQLALALVENLSKGLGGGGILFLIIQAVRWLLRR